MKNTLLFSSIALALVLAGCNKSTRTSTATNDANPDALGTYSSAPAATAPMTADQTFSNAASGFAGSVLTAARMTEWKLNASDIQADLADKREIVRTKGFAGSPTGTMDKSVIKTAVEGRFQADSDLAPLKLDVDADKDGTINLSGKALSADQVGKAMALALDTDGVTKVASKIKLDNDAK